MARPQGLQFQVHSVPERQHRHLGSRLQEGVRASFWRERGYGCRQQDWYLLREWLSVV